MRQFNPFPFSASASASASSSIFTGPSSSAASLSPGFSSSSSPSSVPYSSGISFCVGPGSANITFEHGCFEGSKPDRPRFGRFKKKSPNIPPQSPFPTSVRVEEIVNEDDNPMKAPHQDGRPETNKTKFTTPSAVTGEIPCHFEGSSYASKLSSTTCCTPEESIKREFPDKSEPKLPLTQIVIVSRILKGIPQNPHFLPLKAYSNVAKQRLINAWDNIFEETVDKLLSLQVNGFSADAKRLWETMEELEKMGYDVIKLRRRLVELTDVLVRQRRRRSKITRLKDEAEQHRMEKSRLEFEIVKLKAKVEAEKASVEDIMSKVSQMEDEMPHFNDVFTKLAIKLF